MFFIFDVFHGSPRSYHHYIICTSTYKKIKKKIKQTNGDRRSVTRLAAGRARPTLRRAAADRDREGGRLNDQGNKVTPLPGRVRTKYYSHCNNRVYHITCRCG